MPARPRPLTPAQTIQLGTIREEGKRYKAGKIELEAQIRRKLEEDLAAQEMAYALAIRRGHDLGIPKRRIGREGMGTSDQGTVDRWLAKTAARLVMDGVPDPTGAFSWEDRGSRTLRVRIENFPTTIAEALDYPEVLEGVIQEDDTAANGWRVISDPGTVQVDGGILRGWFTVEVEDVPRSQEGSLLELVDAWLVDHS